ncbi:unnamed protein product, partial [Ixodes persulcatus]
EVYCIHIIYKSIYIQNAQFYLHGLRANLYHVYMWERRIQKVVSVQVSASSSPGFQHVVFKAPVRCDADRVVQRAERSVPVFINGRPNGYFFFFFWQVNSAFICLARYVRHTEVHLRWLRNSAMLRSTVQRHAGGFRLVAVTPPEIAQGNIGVNYKISMGLCSSVVQRRVGVLRLALRRIAADATSHRSQSNATNVS